MIRSASVGLAIGVLAVVVAAFSGAAPDVLVRLAAPPEIVRAALVALAVLVAGWFLRLALERIERARGGAAEANAMTSSDLAVMVRGIRYVFLAAAAGSAGVGWLVGSPLPIVIGLVIAGIDLAETSFLLLVASSRPH